MRGPCFQRVIRGTPSNEGQLDKDWNEFQKYSLKRSRGRVTLNLEPEVFLRMTAAQTNKGPSVSINALFMETLNISD